MQLKSCVIVSNNADFKFKMFKVKHLRNYLQKKLCKLLLLFVQTPKCRDVYRGKSMPSLTPTWNTWSMNHKMRAGDFSVASALKTTFIMLMGNVKC